jgi:hypothetical protein
MMFAIPIAPTSSATAPSPSSSVVNWPCAAARCWAGPRWRRGRWCPGRPSRGSCPAGRSSRAGWPDWTPRRRRRRPSLRSRSRSRGPRARRAAGGCATPRSPPKTARAGAAGRRRPRGRVARARGGGVARARVRGGGAACVPSPPSRTLIAARLPRSRRLASGFALEPRRDLCTEPLTARSSVPSTISIVVFPDPEGPTTATWSPVSIATLTPRARRRSPPPCDGRSQATLRTSSRRPLELVDGTDLARLSSASRKTSRTLRQHFKSVDATGATALGAAVGRAGRTTRTSRPPDGGAVSSIVPPCTCATERTIDNPSPKPP